MVTLPAAWCYLIIVGAIVLGLIEGARLGRHNSINVEDLGRRAPYLYILVPLSFLGFGGDLYLNRDPGLQWTLPMWVVEHYVPVSRGLTLGILTLVFVLATYIGFKMQDGKRWLTLILGVAFLTAFLGWQYQHARPVEIGPPRHTQDGSMILQSNPSTCVAATAANIANHFGIEESEADMVRILGTTAQGTSPGQVVHGMTELGLTCQVVTTSDVLRVKPPAMLFVDSQQGVETHAVALMQVKRGRAFIWDPSFGMAWLYPRSVARVWHGHAIQFSRP